MDLKEKSLALAKIMDWNVNLRDFFVFSKDGTPIGYLCPYKNSPAGLSQFASILLNHPEVMGRVMCLTSRSGCVKSYIGVMRDSNTGKKRLKVTTQENILDEILRMEDKL